VRWDASSSLLKSMPQEARHTPVMGTLLRSRRRSQQWTGPKPPAGAAWGVCQSSRNFQRLSY
jgi:hypothetical protein